MKNIDSGNCIPLESISILHISSNPMAALNATTPQFRVTNNNDNNNNNISTFENECYLPMNVHFTEFSLRVITYIAGFVVKHLINVLHCEDCLEALVGDDNNEQ